MTSKDQYDRAVHATLASGGELVRYDVAAKWFVEYPEPSKAKRRQVNLRTAVQLALEPGAHVRLKVSGGMAFEAKYRAALAATTVR